MCILIIIVCRYLYILYIRRPLLGRARVLLYLAPVEAADSTPRLETSSSYIGSRWAERTRSRHYGRCPGFQKHETPNKS